MEGGEQGLSRVMEVQISRVGPCHCCEASCIWQLQGQAPSLPQRLGDRGPVLRWWNKLRFLAGMRGAPRGQGHPGIWPWAAGHLANIGSRLRRPGLGPTWDEGSEEPGWSLVKERVFVTI